MLGPVSELQGLWRDEKATVCEFEWVSMARIFCDNMFCSRSAFPFENADGLAVISRDERMVIYVIRNHRLASFCSARRRDGGLGICVLPKRRSLGRSKSRSLDQFSPPTGRVTLQNILCGVGIGFCFHLITSRVRHTAPDSSCCSIR